MAGAWELGPQYNVLVGILHTDLTSIAWALGFRNLVIPGQVMVVAGMPYDMARNTIAMRCLEGGFSHCFMLDSDVIPPADAVLRLLKHDKPLISGMYCRRSPPISLPVMMRNGQWVTEFKRGSVIEVDVVGAGCLLIRRDVLERMPAQRPGHQWFDWRVDLQGLMPREECQSEDYTFCRHAKKTLGIPTLVDTSIECKHVGLAQSTFGRFEACAA